MQPETPDEGLRIGAWRLLPSLNLLRRGGEEVRLEPRHVDLLVYLARRPGEVVSAEQILDDVWRGQVVGDNSVYQAMARLRRALGDDAQNPTYIETVTKRGYRLIAAIHQMPGSDAEATPQHGPNAVSPPRWWPLLVAGAIALLAALAWWHWRPTDPPAAPRTALVLPFAALTDEATDHNIAEGFSIELADALGRAPDLRVVGPVSAGLAAESTASDLPNVGRRLDADLVIAGSIRRSGDALRVAARIVDARDGRQLWSRIDDFAESDIFTAQQALGGRMAAFLAGRDTEDTADNRDTDAGHDVQAYDFFLLGRYHRARRSPLSLERAAEFFHQALQREPGFTAARIELATTQLLLSFYGRLPLDQAVAIAAPLLDGVLAKAGSAPEALAAVGLSHYLKGEYGVAEDYLIRATTQFPNRAEPWMWLGLARRQQGKLLDGLEALKKAHELEPLFATAAINYANALAWSGKAAAAQAVLEPLAEAGDPHLKRTQADIAIESGDLIAAYRYAQQAVALDPESELARAGLAMVLAYLGQEESAMRLVGELSDGNTPSRATQRYLDRLGATATGLFGTPALTSPDPQPPAQANVPEISWRLAQARIGLSAYLDGDFAIAQPHLRKALEGRIYPIERTDYDLFLCTTLVDVLRRTGAADESARWLDRCTGEMSASIRRGWRTLATGYVKARLAMLHGTPTRALERLASLVNRGYRNRNLLMRDPLFEPLRCKVGFRNSAQQIEDKVEQAWAEVSTGS